MVREWKCGGRTRVEGGVEEGDEWVGGGDGWGNERGGGRIRDGGSNA